MVGNITGQHNSHYFSNIVEVNIPNFYAEGGLNSLDLVLMRKTTKAMELIRKIYEYITKTLLKER